MNKIWKNTNDQKKIQNFEDFPNLQAEWIVACIWNRQAKTTPLNGFQNQHMKWRYSVWQSFCQHFGESEEDIPKHVSQFLTGATDDVMPYCLSKIPEGTKEGKLNPHSILSAKNFRLS